MSALKTVTSTLTIFALAVLFAGPAFSADSEIDEQKSMDTSFHGRPPFARSRVVSPADLARFEESVRQEPAVSRRVDFRGRPPFTRQKSSKENTPSVDFARFEEATISVPRRRSGPPGKMNRYR